MGRHGRYLGAGRGRNRLLSCPRPVGPGARGRRAWLSWGAGHGAVGRLEGGRRQGPREALGWGGGVTSAPTGWLQAPRPFSSSQGESWPLLCLPPRSFSLWPPPPSPVFAGLSGVWGGGMGAGALGSEVSSARLVQTGPLSSGVSTLGEEGLDVGYPHRVGLLPGAVTLRQVVWPPGAPAAVCLSLIAGDRGSGLTGGRQGGWAAGWSSDHPAFPGAAELRPGHARPPVQAQEAGEEPQSQFLLGGRPRPWPWATHSTSFSGVPLPGGKPWKILLGWDRKLALI